MAMRLRPITVLAAIVMMLLTGADEVEARSIRWARSGDALTLDPYALNEGPTHALAHQIYEPLIIRDALGKAVPTLAESWTITSDPQVWEFKLRRGVTFHDGSPFTADDVIYSFNRARQPTSDMKGLLASVEVMTKVDDFTLRIKTRGPNPIFPSNLVNLMIMSRSWTEKNHAGTVQDFKAKGDNYAVRNANGTGPYILVSREPDVKTVLKRNENYWGRTQFPLDISEVTYLPIQSDAARLAALLSGDVDVVQDVPVADIDKLAADPKLHVNVGPENRSIFLGLNVGSQDLKSSDVKGRNPFADKRVRMAMNHAINRALIQKVTMKGQSLPTGTIVPPGVNGYSKELDVIPTPDPAKAKALLAEAGFADGFTVTLNCPNDRYVNDEAVCKAVVAQLATVGIKVTLIAQTKALYFPLIEHNPPETDFYLLGWGVPTFDSHYIFSNLFHGRTEKEGGWNATRFASPDIDQTIDGLTQETDLSKRNQTIAALWKVLHENMIYLPIHIQTLAYAMKPDLDVQVDILNTPKLKFVKVLKPAPAQ